MGGVRIYKNWFVLRILVQVGMKSAQGCGLGEERVLDGWSLGPAWWRDQVAAADSGLGGAGMCPDTFGHRCGIGEGAPLVEEALLGDILGGGMWFSEG